MNNRQVQVIDRKLLQTYIEHLMTGPKGNSEFCFPETLNVPRVFFFIPLNSKLEQIMP